MGTRTNGLPGGLRRCLHSLAMWPSCLQRRHLIFPSHIPATCFDSRHLKQSPASPAGSPSRSVIDGIGSLGMRRCFFFRPTVYHCPPSSSLAASCGRTTKEAIRRTPWVPTCCEETAAGEAGPRPLWDTRGLPLLSSSQQKLSDAPLPDEGDHTSDPHLDPEPPQPGPAMAHPGRKGQGEGGREGRGWTPRPGRRSAELGLVDAIAGVAGGGGEVGDLNRLRWEPVHNFRVLSTYLFTA